MDSKLDEEGCVDKRGWGIGRVKRSIAGLPGKAKDQSQYKELKEALRG